jgi:hypothetical protein
MMLSSLGQYTGDTAMITGSSFQMAELFLGDLEIKISKINGLLTTTPVYGANRGKQED